MVASYRVEMAVSSGSASAEGDVNYLNDADLLPPKQSSSKVWKFFGFSHEGGVTTDHSHVSHCLMTVQCVLANRYSPVRISTEREGIRAGEERLTGSRQIEACYIN